MSVFLFMSWLTSVLNLLTHGGLPIKAASRDTASNYHFILCRMHTFSFLSKTAPSMVCSNFCSLCLKINMLALRFWTILSTSACQHWQTLGESLAKWTCQFHMREQVDEDLGNFVPFGDESQA